MKLYLAGPVTGVPDDNRAAFRAATAALTAAGFEVRNPTAGARVPGWEWADYMRRALLYLISCNGVALLPGWPASRGATLEVYVAHTLGMGPAVRTVDEWLAEVAS